MAPNLDKTRRKAFVERWQAAQGSEDQESQRFWIEFYQDVLGFANPTRVLRFEKPVSKGKEHRNADVFNEDTGVLVEMKSRGVDLDTPEQRGKDKYGNMRMVTPYEQARWYADNIVPRSIAPKWIVTCNFDEFRIYDLDDPNAESNYETVMLSDLVDQWHRLSFMVKKENSRAELEKQLSIDAGVIVGKLYDVLGKQYRNLETNEREQQSLNILITRIVFLLYAEDADLLHETDAFYKYLKEFATPMMADALRLLFRTLRTPEEERDPYSSPAALAFPYVNGGLFEEEIIIPQFTDDARFILLQEASAEFNWSDISPTIFGSVFESTLNPETRRAGGMHYTTVEYIHRVTGPLFYDALKEELEEIEQEKVEKKRRFKLDAFKKKLASIKVFDPACGSGNFLTETYLSLRKLENRVLEDLLGEQMVMMDPDDLIDVSIDQFFGIEINGFAVEVAKTALWIAELQMLDETTEIAEMWIEPLPLKSNDNIHRGNAVRMDWNDVVPAEECNYIVGNPPFLGYSNLNDAQKADRAEVFGNVSTVDYVACWYAKASEYTKGHHIRTALVSTNSICQGQQVKPIWDRMFAEGNHIDFAWRTFVWNSEAIDQAHVHCVIVGFSREDGIEPTLFMEDGTVKQVANINGYLEDKTNVALARRKHPISDVLPMVRGCQPTDGGNLILDLEERDRLLSRCPEAATWVKPFSMGADFINNKEQFCLWLVGITQGELAAMPAIAERVERVREMRLASKKAATRKKAETPWLFDEVRPPQQSQYLAFPSVSSGRRKYIPIGFVTNGMIPGNKLYYVDGGGLYEFGILASRMHNAWVRSVAGRLKSDFNYSNTIVYNNFVWPDPTFEQHQAIEACAQAVLDARDNHPADSLATLYDPDKMPDDLLAAHKALDAAVEAAYGVDFGGDEERIVAHLFKLYAERVGG